MGKIVLNCRFEFGISWLRVGKPPPPRQDLFMRHKMVLWVSPAADTRTEYKSPIGARRLLEAADELAACSSPPASRPVNWEFP